MLSFPDAPEWLRNVGYVLLTLFFALLLGTSIWRRDTVFLAGLLSAVAFMAGMVIWLFGERPNTFLWLAAVCVACGIGGLFHVARLSFATPNEK